MAKKLIHKNNIYEIYKNGEEKIFISKDVILAPSAKDFIREKNIQIIYKEECLEESLEEKIKRILKDDFNLEDEKLVQIISRKVKGR